MFIASIIKWVDTIAANTRYKRKVVTVTVPPDTPIILAWPNLRLFC